MSVFDRLIDNLLRSRGYLKASDINAPGFLLDYAEAQRFSVPDGTIYANQASLYARVSWVQTAIQHAGIYAAAEPFNVKRKQGEELTNVVNHPLEERLDHPNELQSRVELLEATYAWARLTGNCYWWLNRRSKEEPPVEMWILPTPNIQPVPDGNLYLKGYLFDPGNGKAKVPLETWEILHLKNFNPYSMFVGLSPVEALVMAAEGDLKQQEHSLKFFKKFGGRMPGVLAFADMILDDEWDRINRKFQKKAAEEQVLTLRGVGKGAINYTPMEMSRKDMEFIAQRQMNRTEIYDLYAPGLAAMLDPNANEASGRVGKATLMELAIYPFHGRLAARITSDILPAYGDNLVGEFDDVRLSDRQMELNEQQAAWHVMTIDEVRAKYWELDPLGDPRGEQLVIEAGEMGPVAQYPLPTQMPLALPQGPTASNQQQEVAGQQIDVMQAAPKAVVNAEAAEVQPTLRRRIRDELATWQRRINKRVKAGRDVANLREFEAEYIPPALQGAVEGALEGVTTPEDVALVFADAQAWDYP